MKHVTMMFILTCIHDPGAAQRSMQTLLFCRNSHFLLSWTSLKLARDLYPISLAAQYALSRRCFPIFCFFGILDNLLTPLQICLFCKSANHSLIWVSINIGEDRVKTQCIITWLRLLCKGLSAVRGVPSWFSEALVLVLPQG